MTMKRYDSYKDSGIQWLGEIPSHWELKRWRFLLAENKDVNSRLQTKTQLQFRYGEIVPKSSQGEDEETLNTIQKYTVVAPNDIMINGLNLNYDFISQRVAKVSETGAITSAYVSLRPTEIADPSFYNYLLKAMDSKKMFHGMGSGVRLTLSYKELKSRFLPYPPKEEQETIVAYLDKATAEIDEAIAQQQRMIDLLNERKQIIITQTVTRGLNPNAPLRDSGIGWIGQIPEHWRVRRFKSLYSTRTGITFTKADLIEDGEPVISYGQIHSKENYGTSINPKLIRFIPQKLTKGKVSSLAHKGDFLFADTSEDFEGCGNNVYIDTDSPLYAGYHTILAKSNHSEIGQYLGYLFNSINWRKQVRSKVNGVKVYSITQSIINSTTVILPPIPEQEEIVRFLDEKVKAINGAIEALNRTIVMLQERKQIIINEVVTGKVKVS